MKRHGEQLLAFGLFLTVVHAFFTHPRVLLPAYVRPHQPQIPWPMHTNMVAVERSVVEVDTIVKKTNGVSSLPTEMQKITEQFIEAWRKGLQGDQILLNTLVKPSTRWENPFVATGKELSEGLAQFSSFFGEPSLTVFHVISKNSPRQIEISYHLSFWYPVGWRPRIIIPGKALVTISEDLRSIQSVSESWDVSIADIALKQFLPRWWDVLHVFSSPSPEYPPIKTIGNVGKVNFIELPETVVVEVRWSGSPKYPGPPLLAIPGFSLFGFLKTSNPNKDKFYTSLPVEVQSGMTYPTWQYLRYYHHALHSLGITLLHSFLYPLLTIPYHPFSHTLNSFPGTFYDKTNGQEMKQSSWTFHVPTALHDKVMSKALSETVYPLKSTEIDLESEDDVEYIKDYQSQVNDDNLNVMNSVKKGALRGQNVQFDEQKMAEFESMERQEYRYKVQPSRIVAQVDVKGEATPEKIAEALKMIRNAVESDGKKLFNKKNVTLRGKNLDVGSTGEGITNDKNQQPLLGLQLWGSKACFNMIGEPAMAIYEMQYSYRRTAVQVELIM